MAVGIAVCIINGYGMVLRDTAHWERSLMLLAARAVAGGDLSQCCKSKATMNCRSHAIWGEMTGSLERIVYQVRQGTNSTATASTENCARQQRFVTTHRAAGQQRAAGFRHGRDHAVRAPERRSCPAGQYTFAGSQPGGTARGEAVSRVVNTMSETTSASPERKRSLP